MPISNNNGNKENSSLDSVLSGFRASREHGEIGFRISRSNGGFGFRVSRPNSGRRQARVVEWTSAWGTFCWGTMRLVTDGGESAHFSISALRLCKAQLELEICGLADSLQRTRELGLLRGHGARRLFGAKMSC